MAITLRSVKGSALTHNEMDGNFLLFPRLLASSGAAIANTGNTTENTLATISVPGGSMGPNGFLRINALWSATANTNTKTLKIKFNGTSYANIPHTTGTQVTSSFLTVIQNRNSNSSQVGTAAGVNPTGITQNGAVTTSSHDTTGDLNITFTAQCNTSGTDTITLERYTVEVCYAA